LLSQLDQNYDACRGWEAGDGSVGAEAFDPAIYGLMDALHPYATRGWHCTRLTDAETDHILRNGMQLPDSAMLIRRIDALVAAGQITDNILQPLKAKNQSGDKYRAGLVWFCFFSPRLAGEDGIRRFFRHWGGEALYNSHEDDLITSPAIGDIGTPRIVEADVPVASAWNARRPVFQDLSPISHQPWVQDTRTGRSQKSNTAALIGGGCAAYNPVSRC
jgi:hypothetical protein